MSNWLAEREDRADSTNASHSNRFRGVGGFLRSSFGRKENAQMLVPTSTWRTVHTVQSVFSRGSILSMIGHEIWLPAAQIRCFSPRGSNAPIGYPSTVATVRSTKERKISLICSGVSRLRRPSHHVKTEK